MKKSSAAAISTSFEKPTPLKPGSIHEYRFSLHDLDHVFKAGHTVMVEIQSTWFPLYDRNPQTFVPNIMTAKPEAYKPATITIYSGPATTSRAGAAGERRENYRVILGAGSSLKKAKLLF